MHTKHVYVMVLLVIMGAWFANGPISQPKKINKEVNELPPQLQIIESTGLMGIDQEKIITGGKCNVEFINDKMMSTSPHNIAKDKPLKLVGWAMDDLKERLPEQVVVRFTNAENKHFYALARLGLKRNDVRDYFKLSDRILGAGFDLNLDTHGLAPGTYVITLLMQFDDKTCVCDNNRKIILEQ